MFVCGCQCRTFRQNVPLWMNGWLIHRSLELNGARSWFVIHLCDLIRKDEQGRLHVLRRVMRQASLSAQVFHIQAHRVYETFRSYWCCAIALFYNCINFADVIIECYASQVQFSRVTNVFESMHVFSAVVKLAVDCCIEQWWGHRATEGADIQMWCKPMFWVTVNTEFPMTLFENELEC